MSKRWWETASLQEIAARRAEFEREVREMESDPLYAGPRPYSKWAMIRRVQVILDWYFGPALAITFILSALVSMWLWILTR